MKGAMYGFTLFETMIALLVLGILACIVQPAYLNAVAATRLSETRTLLYDSLIAAATHSTVTRTEVVVCSSSNAQDCNGSIDWSNGWIAFSDSDGDRQRGAGEAIVRHQATLAEGVGLRSTVGRTQLVFQPNGSNAGSNATFTLCHAHGKATTVVLANSGRMRQGSATPEAALACTGG